jgi:hypothetical protein
MEKQVNEKELNTIEENNTENKNIKGNIFQQSYAYTEEQEQEREQEDYTTPVGKKPLDDPEEYDHLKDICAAFFNYQIDSLRDVARMERDFNSIPKSHLQMLKYDYKERLDKLRKAIWKNYLFLLKIVSPYSHMFKFFKNEKNEVLIQPLRVSPKDIVKMRSTLKLFIRDWSSEVSKKISIFINI